MTVLLLIRHGTTAASEKGVLAGWTPGVHLTERGSQQAEQLVDRLRGVPVAAIYSSPLERCRESAAPLASDRGLVVRVRRDLGEVRYGSWTGRRIRQVMRTKLWKVIQGAPSRARFPEGESLLEVQHRAVAELERIVAAHRGPAIAVVSHADVIRLAVSHFSGMHTDLFQRLVIEPASISVVALGEGLPRILRVNDTGDLSTLLARAAPQHARRGSSRRSRPGASGRKTAGPKVGG
ncbi:MAG TPA: MSMEG_4193 family putative phosphomutase [Actinomycetota bacterium]